MTALFLRSLVLLGASLLAVMPARALEYTFRTEWGAQWYAINNAGQIAGDYYRGAALWTGLVPTYLPTFEGGSSSFALGLNNLGQVVGGQYVNNGAILEATLWTPGQAPVALGRLGNGTLSVARDINDAGQVTGRATTEGDFMGSRAFRWQDGIMTDLGTAGGSISYGNAINAAGQVAGISITRTPGEASEQRAVVWTGTQPTLLEGPGGGESDASDINSRGQVVGGGYFWNGETVTSLEGLNPGASATASAINELGQIVGHSFDEQEARTRAVLWDGGAPVDLNSFLSERDRAAGWSLWDAYDINDLGQIVGIAYNVNDGSGGFHGFLLTPVPEPASVVLLLAGLGLVGAAVRRRR